ncbi:hypothetical protein L228DRAFT_275238, partial [Xylona heveae TC161]
MEGANTDGLPEFRTAAEVAEYLADTSDESRYDVLLWAAHCLLNQQISAANEVEGLWELVLGNHTWLEKTKTGYDVEAWDEVRQVAIDVKKRRHRTDEARRKIALCWGQENADLVAGQVQTYNTLCAIRKLAIRMDIMKACHGINRARLHRLRRRARGVSNRIELQASDFLQVADGTIQTGELRFDEITELQIRGGRNALIVPYLSNAFQQRPFFLNDAQTEHKDKGLNQEESMEDGFGPGPAGTQDESMEDGSDPVPP